MTTWTERLLLRWLRAVAPRDWTDTVLGDLREEHLAPGRSGGARLNTALAHVAVRLTIEAVWRSGRRSWGAVRSSSPRQAIRALWHAPGYSVVAILTLALAIGANTAIYSALRTVVLDPFPFKDGERFVIGFHTNPAMGGVLVSPPQAAIDAWRTATSVIEVIETFGSRSAVLTGAGEPEEMSISLVSPTLFPTLGVSPGLGRGFQESDTRADAPAVLLVSHAFWVNRFGADPALIGKTLTLGDTIYTVIGVMPRRFALPMGSDVMWAAARINPRQETANTLVKLRSGVTLDEAQQVMAATTSGSTDPDLRGWSPSLMSPGDYNGRPVKNALPVLAGAVGLLLLIACVNVANLTLTRNSARHRELGVRFALGASRARLVGGLLCESLIVAALGGLAGLGVAQGGLRLMAALRPDNLDVLDRVYLDAGALGFSAAVSLVTGVILGILPGITASRVNLQGLLASGGRAATISRHRARRLLTIAQVAVALVLMIGASLLLKSYARLTAVDPGFDPRNLLTVSVSLPPARYPASEPARRAQFFEDTLESIRRLPGVQSAALGNGIPPATGILFGTLAIEGRAPGDAKSAIFGGGYVTPSYFSTLGIPILDGRGFTDDDTVGRERVVMISQSLADAHWPGRSPIGAHLKIQARDVEWATVVGVVRDVKTISLASTATRPQLYFPRAQLRPGFGAFIIRTAGNPHDVIPMVKARIWDADAGLPIRDVATGDDVLRRDTSQARFNLVLLVAFAASGLALVVVGVYGVTAMLVNQRTRELAIRLALGATPAAVTTLVLRQTAGLLVFGLLLGAGTGLAVSRYLESLLFGTQSTDPLSFAAGAAVIGISALVATLIPLRRASTLSPTTALSAE